MISARIADRKLIGVSNMQTVVRTAPTPSGYWRDSKRYEELDKLLHNGWKVVMCNYIGNDLEYILEKEENRDEN